MVNLQTQSQLKELNNKSHLKENRRELRKSLTPAEATLCRILKRKALGAKFRRQHSVGNYILDFYCPSYCLAIELDGGHHFTEEGLKYDAERDKYLVNLGIKILRIEINHVFERPDWVIQTIGDCLK